MLSVSTHAEAQASLFGGREESSGNRGRNGAWAATRLLALLFLAWLGGARPGGAGEIPGLAGDVEEPPRDRRVAVERIDHVSTTLAQNSARYEVFGRDEASGEQVTFAFETALFDFRNPKYYVFREGERAEVRLSHRGRFQKRLDQEAARHDTGHLPRRATRVIELWVGAAFLLIVGAAWQALLSARAAVLRRLLRYARPYILSIGVVILCLFVSAGCEMVFVLLARDAVNLVTTPAPDLVWFITEVLVACAVLLGLSNFAAELFSRQLMWGVVTDIRQDLGAHLLGLSMRFFARTRTGELISRLTNDINTTQMALRFVFSDIVREVITIVFGVSLAFIQCWQLGIIVFVLFPLTVVPVGVIARRVSRAANKGLEQLAEVTDRMQQMFTGIRVIKAFRMEAHEKREFARVNRVYLRRVGKMVYNRALARGLVFFVTGFTSAVMFAVGSWLIAENLWGLTIDRFIAFILATVVVYKPSRVLVKAYNELQESLAGARRIFEVLDLRSDLVDAPNAPAMPPFRESIAFRAVSFAYTPETPVLRDITLTIGAGERVALVGAAGVGKSTLMDLIPRFHDPTAGAVLIDGRDIRSLSHASLLAQIAIVTQHPFLFNTTVAENIRYGRPAATMEDVMEAARIANIHDEILALPAGYDTVVGERGENLSGGQRQRVTIARAVIKNAPILLLDEATSSLDSESEKSVQEALVRAMAHRTTVTIAHRLSTVIDADRIVVLAAGAVEDVGSHRDLIARCETYRRLYETQHEAMARAGR